jgi:hypothetical protein
MNAPDHRERICYRVFEQDNRWVVQFDHHDDPRPFASRQAALQSAEFAADARWQITHIPSCVVVRSSDGVESEVTSYG